MKFSIPSILCAILVLGGCSDGSTAPLDPAVIADAADAETSVTDSVVRIGWSRDDVPVQIDTMDFPPSAGLGSWAAFKAVDGTNEAMVMGDTVVFQDEVDAAMDAAFAHDLAVTALHNHFFHDDPAVYFMHISGRGPATDLARGVRAMWDAIREVRAANAVPATGFGGPAPDPAGSIDPDLIEETTGLEAEVKPDGVVKISEGRVASMHGTSVGGPMGLASWAAFTGSDDLAAMDGDIIMSADEVQPVLQALRAGGVHVVALHNHMIGESPAQYFTHFWGKGSVAELSEAFRDALWARQSRGRE